MTRNWKPVIESLLDALEEQRITLHSVLDEEATLFIDVQGDSPAERRSHAIELIDGVDSTALLVGFGDCRVTMILVFDENPADLIADWNVPRSKTFEHNLEAAAEAFSSRWEGKPCPQQESTSERIIVRVTESNVGFANFDSREEAEEWIEEPDYDNVRWTILDSSSEIVDDDEDDSTEGKPCPDLACDVHPMQEERFDFVTVTFWLTRKMDGDEIMSFVCRKADDQDVEEYEYAHVLLYGSCESGTPTAGAPWEDDSVQFPRLIAELEAQGLFSSEVVGFLAESMDLDPSHVYELVDRAQLRWDKIKSDLVNQ